MTTSERSTPDTSGSNSTEEKIAALQAAGVKVAMHPEQIPDLL